MDVRWTRSARNLAKVRVAALSGMKGQSIAIFAWGPATMGIRTVAALRTLQGAMANRMHGPDERELADVAWLLGRFGVRGDSPTAAAAREGAPQLRGLMPECLASLAQAPTVSGLQQDAVFGLAPGGASAGSKSLSSLSILQVIQALTLIVERSPTTFETALGKLIGEASWRLSFDTESLPDSKALESCISRLMEVGVCEELQLAIVDAQKRIAQRSQ